MSFSRSARACLAATAAGAVAATVGLAAPAAADDTTPKNIIIFIADGMGYNHVDAASLYQYGESNWQVAVDPDDPSNPEYQENYGQNPSQVYEAYDVQVGLSHWSLNTYTANGVGYDGEAAWSDFDWVRPSPTDSAAAGTALATGVKTINGYLGVDEDGNPVQNMAEYAQQTGRSAGVVSDVPFGHATPASWGAHVASRSANHEIAEQMVYGDLDVIIGAGHPLFDDDGQPRDPHWSWLTEGQYADLQDGQTPFTFAETNEGIEAVAAGAEIPERFFGLAPVAETLQYNRSSLTDAEARRGAGREDGVPLTEEQQLLPYEAERNDVVSLADMTSAALNVLSQNENGFFTMIEAGAVDWAGHANATTGNIEEMVGFNEAVETAHAWVEENSSWDETLVIVTADHETGYLDGPHGDPEWTIMEGEQGQLPVDGWYSGDHTNHLVPLFAHGAGSERIHDYIRGEDPVRGAYIDNVDVAQLGFDLWAADRGQSDGIPLDVTVPSGDGGGPGDGALVLSIEDTDGVELTGGHNVGDARRFLGTLPTISVTDSRSDAEAGSDGGWTVSGQASDLTAANRTIRAGHLGWTPALVEARQGVEAGSKIASVLRDGEGLAQPQTLGSAGSVGRVGTTGLTAELALEVPVTTQAGEYAGELTVSLFPVD